MKSRFALALLASVAVIAAMTTDASAAGRGSGGGGGHGGGGGGFHGGGGGGFHGGGGGFHAMVAAACAWAAADSTPMHSRRQFRRGARGQRARICGTQFRRWRLLPSNYASRRVQRVRPGPRVRRAKRRRRTLGHQNGQYGHEPRFCRQSRRRRRRRGVGAAAVTHAQFGAQSVRRAQLPWLRTSIRRASTGTPSATPGTGIAGAVISGAPGGTAGAVAGAAGRARSSGRISTATSSASRSGPMTITIRSGSMA